MSSKRDTTTAKKDGKPALVPELRFPEFSDTGGWEQKFVEEFFNVGSSKRVLQQDWIAHGIPFYRTRELVSLSKNEAFSSEIFISKTLFEEITQKYGAPQEGDFLVSGVGTLGISYLVKKGDEFYFKDGNVLWFSTKGGIISLFFKYCFESDAIQGQIRKQASVSTVGTYTIQNAKRTWFYYPPTDREQQKIADCLDSVDALIAAQGRKVEALRAHKTGLMQQLFPQEGESQPRLRFPEFERAGEWEEATVEEIIVTITPPKKLQTSDYQSEGAFPIIDQSQDYIGGWTNDGEAVIDKRLPVIVFGDHTCVLKFIDRPFVQGADGIKILGPKRGINVRFLFYALESNPVTQENYKRHFSALKEKKLSFPDPKSGEQHRIADCLTSLDDHIAAETRKLDTLKTHKKGLMQQLFPQIGED